MEKEINELLNFHKDKFKSDVPNFVVDIVVSNIGIGTLF
jgi:hypothetical protein